MARAAPVTRMTWLPAPSEPVRTWASSEKSRPSGERGGAMASSREGFERQAISTGTLILVRSRGPRIRRSRRSQRKARIRPISSPASKPLGMTSSFFGLDGLDGGVALLMMDPPDGLASSAVSAATWLFSESSWLWSEVSCCWAVARCDELLGRLPTSTVSLADADSRSLILDCRDEIWLLRGAVVLVLL